MKNIKESMQELELDSDFILKYLLVHRIMTLDHVNSKNDEINYGIPHKRLSDAAIYLKEINKVTQKSISAYLLTPLGREFAIREGFEGEIRRLKKEERAYDSTIQANIYQTIALYLTLFIAALTFGVLMWQSCILSQQAKIQEKLLPMQSQPSLHKEESHDVFYIYPDSLKKTDSTKKETSNTDPELDTQ